MSKIIASLFSGCGGLDLGFTGGFSFMGHDYERLNTEIVFANDFDSDAQTCYNSNDLLVKDGVYCLLKDIRSIETQDIPNFDILLAGFPCQPFSNEKGLMIIMVEVLYLKSVNVLLKIK